MPIVNKPSLQHYFQTITQMNPFDAVLIIQEKRNTYTVEQINTKAAILFDAQFEKGMAVNQFVSQDNWLELKRCIEKGTGSTSYMTLATTNHVVVYIQAMEVGKNQYFTIILRAVSSDVIETYESNLEAAKHLYFVEHYVDPVISLDLNGQIVYLNVAAKKELANAKNLIGELIYPFIHEDSLEQFKKILSFTYEGNTSSMVKIALKNNFYSNEHVRITTFPTYWDGKIIGSHLIVKNIDTLFNHNQQFFLAYEDELTGLYNRRALNERWHYLTNPISELNVALLLIDIDRFKRFNESLGKQKADLMLAEISNRLLKLSNEFCELFRYNGDEFVAVVRFGIKEEVEVVANKIVQLLKEAIVVDQQDYYVTASIGISTTYAQQVADLERMLHEADQALFTVKEHGRGHFRFYRKEMSQSFPNEALMEAHLKRAIEFNELSLYLQPQLDLQSNTIPSFEALMRWNNRKFGAVSPAQFIPLAESSGLIIQLGDWILEEVVHYLHEWHQKGYKPVRIAVNISPKQFKREGFVEHICSLLQKYKVDAKYLELEITEGSMMNVQETSKILHALKKIGVFVSVDDFGTGYSSLSYLTTYPIDIIKIDQSFIADMSKGVKNESLVKAIINLSQNLGLEVIAEGVEKQEQEQFLLENKCTKVQGYLYNKPLPVEEAVALYFKD